MKLNVEKRFVPLGMVALFWLFVVIAHGMHQNAAPGLRPLPSCRRVLLLIVPGLRAGDWDDQASAPDLAKLTAYCPTALFPIPAPLRGTQASAVSPDERLRLACARLLGANETNNPFAKNKSTVRLTVLDSGDVLRAALPAYTPAEFMPPVWMMTAPNAVGGQATDPARIAQSVHGIWSKDKGKNNAPRLVVAVLDDVYRADGYAPLCLPSAAQKARQSALRRISETVAALTRRGDYGEPYPDAVLLAAPLPSPVDTGGAEEAERMGFLLLWNPKDEKGGHLLLTSPSTRHTPGVIAFGDLAPTLLQMLGVTDAKNVGGRPLETVAVRNGGRAFAAQTAQWAAQWRELRFVVVLPWILAGLLIAAVYLAARRQERISAACALFACTLPAALWAAAAAPLLIALGVSLVRSSPAGGVGGGGLALYALAVLLAALAVLVPAARKTPLASVLMCVAGATVGLVTLDLTFGGPLLGRSPFSYSVLEGARFYGIGNEASGILLGASLVWAALLPSKPRQFRRAAPCGIGYCLHSRIADAGRGRGRSGCVACRLGNVHRAVRFQAAPSDRPNLRRAVRPPTACGLGRLGRQASCVRANPSGAGRFANAGRK